MPAKNQALTLTYTAWNTSTNSGQTGDAANHALKVVVDGAIQAVTATPAQVSASLAPGEYAVALSAGNMNGDMVMFCGESTTPNVVIIPIPIFTDQGGVTVATNKDKAGYSLTQAFPARFSSMSIDTQGNVRTGGPVGGVAAAGSSAGVVVLSGLPTKSGTPYQYAAQRLYNTTTGEARAIASQSYDPGSGNYTFTLGTGTGEDGPFSAAPTTSPTPDTILVTP